MGMIGICMFFVGAVLFLNGLWLLGKADSKPVGFFNLLVGVLCTILAINNHFHATGLAEHLATANTLLFAFTYLMIAANILLGYCDNALGWFCLYVAAATVPNTVFNVITGDFRFAVIWLAWGLLWFWFFAGLVLKYQRAIKTAPYFSMLIGLICTGIPGYMILWGVW